MALVRCFRGIQYPKVTQEIGYVRGLMGNENRPRFRTLCLRFEIGPAVGSEEDEIVEVELNLLGQFPQRSSRRDLPQPFGDNVRRLQWHSRIEGERARNFFLRSPAVQAQEHAAFGLLERELLNFPAGGACAVTALGKVRQDDVAIEYQGSRFRT